MKNRTGKSSYWLTISAFYVFAGCASTDTSSSGIQSGSVNNAGAMSAGVGGTGNAASGGASGNASIGGKAVTAGTIPQNSGNGAAGARTAGGSGNNSAGTEGAAGASGTVEVEVKLAPSVRNPKYKSLAPALGEPLPSGTPGTWNWIDIDGALSRDGSPAGFYYKYSKTGCKKLLIYLAGGGACFDPFTCTLNPYNKDVSLTADSVLTGIGNLIGPSAEPQDPSSARFQNGILGEDPANPVKDWNMVFVPYVTGDVYEGSKPNGTVDGFEGTHQFVGHLNMVKFLERIIPTFKDAPVVVMSGTSAGGIGAYANYPWVADGFIDQKKGARVFLLDDSGPVFDDEYLEVCLQKAFRDVWALDDTWPKDCTQCFSSDGGKVNAIMDYIADKYPDVLLGGFIDSDQDEIFKLFYSEGLENCSYINNPVVGMLFYPADRYPLALEDMLTNHFPASRMSAYVWSGTLHQNLFETATGARFWEKNGLDKTIAEWLATMLTGKLDRIGVIP